MILVVVDRGARTLIRRLEAPHRERFPREETDPPAPVELRVVDEFVNKPDSAVSETLRAFAARDYGD